MGQSRGGAALARERGRPVHLSLDEVPSGPDQHSPRRCYAAPMGVRNYLIEGVSGTGKTSVCRELQRRGQHAVNGDTELAYQGDPETGEPLPGLLHEHHIWDVAKVRSLVADRSTPVTFFCGGSRNHARFIDLFDGVFVLEVDADTLVRRLAARPVGEWGGRPAERELALRLRETKEDLPDGTVIDATAPLTQVVEEILRLSA